MLRTETPPTTDVPPTAADRSAGDVADDLDWVGAVDEPQPEAAKSAASAPNATTADLRPRTVHGA